MGLVKISENMHANLRSASVALSRSINAQAEHWMRVGMLAELHPALDYSEICQMLIHLENAGETVLTASNFNVSELAASSLSKAAS
ncbi:ParD-like family protein [Pseudomonas syringae pv. syringae]|uniref:ParD-like family protein n=1 Tax=Pseudomonas syringae TaxID=317 RepID=UPI001F0FEB8B|nr:ParD-like family protein [Pseudomonas syringae]MCH5548158.1 ParD-like family protein [Pseudomonas syringae pv. syringae]